MKDKITKQAVESLNSGTKDRFLWDTELPMFGCKITPKGRRVYLLQYRIKGRSRRFTIGTHGVLSAREARNIAKNLLHEVVLGRDPADKNNKGDQADGKIQNRSSASGRINPDSIMERTVTKTSSADSSGKKPVSLSYIS